MSGDGWLQSAGNDKAQPRGLPRRLKSLVR
jgi:hypothetical protein